LGKQLQEQRWGP